MNSVKSSQNAMQIEEPTSIRISLYPVNKLILNRWSQRAMSGEELAQEELMALFEAARWAPSTSNSQPWRFIYAKKNSPYWNVFVDLLVDFNKTWAKNASALVVLITKKTFDRNGMISPYHQFDAGAATENLALEASSRGLVTHSIGGFDRVRAREKLGVPQDYEVVVMIAIGKPAPSHVLPEMLQKMEAPSDRKPLKEIVMEGTFRQLEFGQGIVS